MMKRKSGMLLAAFACLGVSGVALAGAYYPAEVTISVKERWANGAVTPARRSADTTQYIGCGVNLYPEDGSPSYGYCVAEDAKNVRIECRSTDPKMMELMQSVTAISLIQVSWDSAMTCKHLEVANMSLYLR